MSTKLTKNMKKIIYVLILWWWERATIANREIKKGNVKKIAATRVCHAREFCFANS